MVNSVADSERHCIFLVKVTKIDSNGHYLPQVFLQCRGTSLGSTEASDLPNFGSYTVMKWLIFFAM